MEKKRKKISLAMRMNASQVFCQGGIGWHWFESSISEDDDDETVPELWDGKEDDSSSEGESILCRRLEGQRGDTSSEDRAWKMMERHTLQKRLNGMILISGMLMSILSRKPSLCNLHKKESWGN